MRRETLTVRGTQALVSFAPLAFKLFCAGTVKPASAADESATRCVGPVLRSLVNCLKNDATEDARGSQKKKIYPARKSASQLPQKKSDWS